MKATGWFMKSSTPLNIKKLTETMPDGMFSNRTRAKLMTCFLANESLLLPRVCNHACVNTQSSCIRRDRKTGLSLATWLANHKQELEGLRD